MGIAAHGPVNLASDSQAYIGRANRQLAGEDLAAKRPWPLQNDGDLWRVLDKVAKANWPSSIRIGWAKGHATAEHVAAGITSESRKSGNDAADGLADRGAIWDHRLGAIEIAQYFADQHAAWIKLVKRMHRVMYMLC